MYVPWQVVSKFRLRYPQPPKMIPILKIPFILASALAVHVGYTPPNAPPPQSERPSAAETRISDRFLGLAILYFNPAIKVRNLSSSECEMKI